MKKRLFFFAFHAMMLVFPLSAYSQDNLFQVKVSITAETNTRQVKQELAMKAQKSSIAKYLLQCNAEIPEKILEEAQNGYSLYVDEVEKLNEKWEQLDKEQGQLSGEFVVHLKLEELNQWIEKKGFKQQLGIALVVMEEMPDLGGMKLDKAFGTGIEGQKFFMQRYTTFQRRIRDAIIKKVGTFGFDVQLLEDNDLYSEYKSKNATLVGVYFDTNNDNFVIDDDLLNAVKANDPDTLVLFYRVDALIYDPETRCIRSTLAFNIKNLASNVTKAIGSQSFEIITKASNADMVIDDFAFCIESAMNALMNAEGAATKLNNIAMSIKNAADMDKGPLKLVINASAFDVKIRKKAMYMIRKNLIDKKIASGDKIKSSNTSLTATITNNEITDVETLYMEHLYPILEEIGVELEDDKVYYNGNNLIIKP